MLGVEQRVWLHVMTRMVKVCIKEHVGAMYNRYQKELLMCLNQVD